MQPLDFRKKIHNKINTFSIKKIKIIQNKRLYFHTFKSEFHFLHLAVRFSH
jgi:hypothetical protein